MSTEAETLAKIESLKKQTAVARNAIIGVVVGGVLARMVTGRWNGEGPALSMAGCALAGVVVALTENARSL